MIVEDGRLVFAKGGACALLALVTSCAPKSSTSSDGGSNARVSIVLKPGNEGGAGRALSVNGTEVSLPNNFCYVVHITGEGITDSPPAQNVCGPETGTGQFSPLAYNRGDTAELTIKVGTQRRFDLIGFVSPLGNDAGGRAICGELSVESGAGPVANDRDLTLKIKGMKLQSAPVLFATGTGDVGPGDNVVALAGVPLVSTPLTNSLSLALGAPYLRKDIPGAAPAGCPPTVSAPTKLSDQTLFTQSGAGLSVPKASSESNGVLLQRVTTSPVLLRLPASSGGAGLSTGLLEINRQRK